MTRVLLIVDYTNDFIADNDSLSCGKPARDLEDYLTELTDKFYGDDDYVTFLTGGHTGDKLSPEYELFPSYSVIGTPGQKLCDKLKDWYENHKSSKHTYKSNRNRYSSFQNTNPDNYLRERKIDDLWLTGIYTDICVLHTAVSTHNLNHGTTIPTKDITTLTEHEQERALGHFRDSLDAKVV